MNETFRIPQPRKTEMFAVTAFFLVLTLIGASIAIFGQFVARHSDIWNPVGFGCFIAVCFGMFLVLFLYSLVASCNEFGVAGASLSIQFVFQNRTFDVHSVDLLRWRPNWRRLEFHAAGKKTIIDLSGFRRDDQLKIIRIVRSLIPEAKQQGWPIFCKMVALPLRDGIGQKGLSASYIAQLPPASFVLVTRRRYDRGAMIILALTLPVVIALWRMTGKPGVFGILPVEIVWYLLLRRGIPSQGRREVKLSAMPIQWAVKYMVVIMSLTVLAAAISIFLGLGSAVGERFFRFAMIPIGILFLHFFYLLIKAAVAEEREHAAGAPAAVAAWDAGENDGRTEG